MSRFDHNAKSLVYTDWLLECIIQFSYCEDKGKEIGVYDEMSKIEAVHSQARMVYQRMQSR